MRRINAKYFAKPLLGVNCTSVIRLRYKAAENRLHVRIYSDEFDDKAHEYCDGVDIYGASDSIDIQNEFRPAALSIADDDWKTILRKLGDFSAEFYFSVSGSSTEDMEKFLYKHKMISERYEYGIILYRNSFSISSYEGKKDWIKLGARSRKSPAQATHPTGSWRVRENHLSGKVEIDKQRNAMLMDLSNRQGLDENSYYKAFVAILDKGIRKFRAVSAKYYTKD